MTDVRTAPLCPGYERPGTPTDGESPEAIEFPWSCATCGILYADGNPTDGLTFTLPPTDYDVLGTLTDKHGASYVVHAVGDAEWYLVQVHGEHGPVARAHLRWVEPPVMLVADVIVDARLRNRGIGAALMQHIMVIARHNKLTTLRGFVVRDDVAGTPYRLAWYERLAFEVQREPPGGDTVAWISASVK